MKQFFYPNLLANLKLSDEIIDDRMEDGMAEEEAICGLGSIEDIAREVMLDHMMSLTLQSKLLKEKIIYRKIKVVAIRN
ncbi:hypothetical protein [Paenibacillus pseudetheri]|uniref:Uncharacterized protein n=1 Tax=Paenibacillus pseudetheri TaxID=2897682 RepID=A0ABN8FLT3_9BACL|nr:hypothetical protein [Paenibacillus pseudetheri]CAH1057449.1 hypothetical protein PAECIP111894_03607 [Paenibacillus pseudetheri]